MKDNVVISADGRALLCDLGCARMSIFSCSMAKITETPKGTAHYWAPELYKPGVVHSEETDVWAFGMTVYVSICSQLANPFSHRQRRSFTLAVDHLKG